MHMIISNSHLKTATNIIKIFIYSSIFVMKYKITVKTGSLIGAGTDGSVSIRLTGNTFFKKVKSMHWCSKPKIMRFVSYRKKIVIFQHSSCGHIQSSISKKSNARVQVVDSNLFKFRYDRLACKTSV